MEHPLSPFYIADGIELWAYTRYTEGCQRLIGMMEFMSPTVSASGRGVIKGK